MTIANKVQSKVPQLRFPEFDGEWEKTNIGKLVKLTMGFAFKSEDFCESGIQLIRMGNVYQNTIQLDRSPVYLPENYKETYKRFLVEKNDMLMSMTGTVGKEDYGFTVKVKEEGKFLLNQRVAKIDAAELHDSNFVLYTLRLRRVLEKVYSLPGGTKQANLSSDQLKSIQVRAPSNTEEEKVGSLLATIDKKISLLKQKHEQLVQYKKGIMQQLFSQQLRFKDDNGQDFPDWEVKHLSELADKVTKKNADDAVKSVLTNSAKHGIVNQLDYFDKDIANENNLTNYGVVEKDDFVYNPRISVLAPVGPVKRNHICKGVMSPLYTVFRFKNTDLLDFLEIFFGTTFWHRYMNSIANFGARHDRMNITSGDFFALPIKIPCEEERTKLVDFVKSVDQKVNLAQQQIEQIQTYKQGLLQQMFV